ncbi:hypothetical protein [Ktedonosporobacter rubrisoli]|uniref:hypothetical protein n=1 Tax=Ktedonosporobacter rubrisoli TaxID=2509675 RepID=UPI0013EE5166|nr:hypothetical protein [Ktedonosporobacter rubrisoli]
MLAYRSIEQFAFCTNGQGLNKHGAERSALAHNPFRRKLTLPMSIIASEQRMIPVAMCKLANRSATSAVILSPST